MNDSVFSLIQEKRKLFYSGILRNQFKKMPSSSANSQANNPSNGPTTNNKNAYNFKSRSINILQELFNE